MFISVNILVLFCLCECVGRKLRSIHQQQAIKTHAGYQEMVFVYNMLKPSFYAPTFSTTHSTATSIWFLFF